MAIASSDTAIRTGRVTRFFLYLVLILFALFYLLPFGVMLVNSVKPLAEITGGNMLSLPDVWTLEPWFKAIKASWWLKFIQISERRLTNRTRLQI